MRKLFTFILVFHYVWHTKRISELDFSFQKYIFRFDKFILFTQAFSTFDHFSISFASFKFRTQYTHSYLSF